MLLGILILTMGMLAACGDNKEPEVDITTEAGDNGQTMDVNPNAFNEFKAAADKNAIIGELEGVSLTNGELIEMLEAENILEPGIADYAVDETEVLKGYSQQLLLHKLIAERAKTDGFELDKSLLDEEIDYINSDMLPDMTAEQEDYIRKLVGQYMLITEYMNTLVKDSDAQKFYEDNKQEFTNASVRHILISFEDRTEAEALELANSLVDRLRSGEDMATLAKEYTEDPGSKENGGLYADAPIMQWVDEFKQASLDQEIDEIGDPVKTTFGYHIIRVEDRNVRDFAMVQEMVKKSLAQEKFAEFMMEYQDKAVVNL